MFGWVPVIKSTPFKEIPMKVLVCDKTEKECIEQMRAAGLTVDVRDDITPEDLPTVLPMREWSFVRGPRCGNR
jgi:hypothetical protein